LELLATFLALLKLAEIGGVGAVDFILLGIALSTLFKCSCNKT
jgi:hypothetical protein